MPDKTAAELSATAGLLSSIYICKPTREAIKNWKALLSAGALDSLQELRKAIQKVDLHSEREWEDLLWEFTRLFIGPYKLPCPPWESVYTSGKRLMMQETYDEVKDFYEEIGLTVSSPDIMPDHVGAELNFLSLLFDRVDSDPGNGLYYGDAAKKFLDEHLKRWIPLFTRDMEEAAELPFYRALARTTREFIMDKCKSSGF